MSIYKSWADQAYDKQGQAVPKVWELYMPQEQKIYEGLLENNCTNISGSIGELAGKYGMSMEMFMGFIDGINETLDIPFTPEEVQALEESSHIDISFEFERLYKKMVEYKADHLYNLPQWDNVLTPERRDELYTEQKNSTTVRKEPVPGRNEQCPCGSGNKFKKCCVQ